MSNLIERYKADVLDELSKHVNATLTHEVEHILSDVAVRIMVEAGCFSGETPASVAEQIMRERDGRLHCGGL